MPRPTRRAAFAAVSLLLVACAAAPAGAADALGQARELLERNDGRSAAALLEDALLAVSADIRPELLRQLRTAYAAAIREAVAAGKLRDADAYRDNLAILQRTPSGKIEASETASLKSIGAQASTLIPELTPALDAAAASRPHKPPEAPRALADPADLAMADAAFRAKRYDEAGRIYAALDQAGRLPGARRDPWAYCRMFDVVRRINAAPRSPEEWSGIQAEIRQIRQLSPKNWYAEYLRNLTLELAPKGKPRRPDTKRVVLRGSAPDEPLPALTPPATARADAPGGSEKSDAAGVETLPSAPPTAPRIGQPGQPIANWKVWETPSFRILHADDALAERIARIAETARAEQTRRWTQAKVTAPWSPRCDIYLYPSAVLFHQMTGQPEGSPGFSTMELRDGRVSARRINLRADHPSLQHVVLPHEITHVVMSDLFPIQQIPRWADEGIAVLSEPPSEQDLRAFDLAKPLETGQLFKVSDLMVMDYPNGQYWSLYYAQSVSLTRYLVEQGTPAQFVKFVRDAQRAGIESELRRVYKIEGFDDLQKRWVSHARQSTSAIAAANAAAQRRR